MLRFLNPVVLTVIALLVAGAFGFAYATHRIGLGTLIFLSALTLMLGVIAVIFVRKMTHPEISVEEMLYKTDHPTRT
jgi:hypothetical protein